MNAASDVIAELRLRGELWEAGPGLVGLRGDALALLEALDRELATLVGLLAPEAWRVPPAIGLETLARAGYFAAFPQWLTVVSHLTGDATALEAVAASPDPASAARAALAPADAALPPAACYHVYAKLADSELPACVRAGIACTCWRHEGHRLAPLARGWAFTMREAVCVGGEVEVERFRARGVALSRAFCAELGLEGDVVAAEDPFFAPTARGRALLQRLKALKHELVIELPRSSPLAIASFNDHERFFGDAFAIRSSTGEPAASGCIAFGVERWLLAFLATHGPAAAGWPAVAGAAGRAARLAPGDVAHVKGAVA